MFKEGEILIYCGETNILHTKNKKYFINKTIKYFNEKRICFICITDDTNTDNWYNIDDLEEDTFFKKEKKFRLEKLKYLNEI